MFHASRIRVRYTLLYLLILLGSLASCFGQTDNLFNPNTLQGTSGNPSGPYDNAGNLQNYGFPYERVRVAGYANVVSNFTIGATGGGNTSYEIPFFDASGNYIPGSSVPSVYPNVCITVPAGAVTMGVSGVNFDPTTAIIKDVCTVASSYIAYVPPAPTISFSIPNHLYNDAPFNAVATSNSTGAFTYSASGVATVSGNTVTLTGQNGSVIVTASESADANFGAGSATASFTVSGAPIPVAPAITIGAIPNHRYTDGPFSVTANTNSTAPLQLSIASGPATISNGVITLTGGNGIVVVQGSTAAVTGFSAGSASAQFIVYGAPVTGPQPGYTTVTASHLGGDVSLISNATITFTPVSTNGTAISFRVGGPGGAIMVRPVSAQVFDGIVNIQLPDSCLSSPLHVAYSVKVVDNVSGAQILGPGYGYIQPCGPTWSLDTYIPNLPNLALVTPGAAGESAYQLAQDGGFSGTVSQWLASLVGAAGPAGAAGANSTVPGPAGTTTQTGTTGGFYVNGPLAVNGYSKASLRAALANAQDDPQAQGRNGYACVLNLSDSILNGTGPAETADQPLNQLRSLLTAYPSGGYGLIPILAYPGAAGFAWQFSANSGSWSTSHEFGPYQAANNGLAIDSLAVGSGNAVATLNSPGLGVHYGGTKLNFLGASVPGDSGWDITVDSTVVGTSVCAAGSASSASLCKATYTVSSGDHNVTITPHGGGTAHAYGVEWIANDHGVLIENMGHGTARSDAYGSDTVHQLAYISQLSCVPDAVVVEFGTNDVLQGNITASAYSGYLAGMYSYVNSINPNASWFVLDGPSVHYPGSGMTEAQEQAAEAAFAQSIGADYRSLKDDWGSFSRGNALGANSGDNIHPSDKGSRYIGWALKHWMVD